MPEQIETTYADLRPTDLVIDKAGNAWPIGDWAKNYDIDHEVTSVEFWLLEPVTKLKKHYITKPGGDPVTVSRVPSHADEAAKLEAEFPGNDYEPHFFDPSPNDSSWCDVCSKHEMDHDAAEDAHRATMAEAIANVEEIGGTVEAEVTAVEVDAASAATEDAPITLPPFADMTPLERRSHLYLLHGIYATDVRSNDELVDMHQQAHAGAVVSKTVPHVHQDA